ncbi:MAG: hypothetical protein ACI8XO_003743 [Verrucomicrobiales bacterium]
MNDTAFTELALKFLDGSATQGDVDRLEAAMLDQAERRAIYRDIVQQSQLAHELRQGEMILAQTPRRPITRIAVASAAAAAVILLALFVLPRGTGNRNQSLQNIASAPEQPEFFKGKAPSWLEIYHSLFEFPEFVWRSEFRVDTASPTTPDAFSEIGLPPSLAAAPATEFGEFIAPIVMLPGAWDSGNRLY